MLELVCIIGIMVVGIVFLGLIGLLIYYFNKILNYILYLKGIKMTPTEELPNEISFEDLEEFVTKE